MDVVPEKQSRASLVYIQLHTYRYSSNTSKVFYKVMRSPRLTLISAHMQTLHRIEHNPHMQGLNSYFNDRQQTMK